MPLYEYACLECDAQFEVLTRISGADERPACPVCGAARARRVISLVAARVSRDDASLPASMPTPGGMGGGCCGGACGCGH